MVEHQDGFRVLSAMIPWQLRPRKQFLAVTIFPETHFRARDVFDFLGEVVEPVELLGGLGFVHAERLGGRGSLELEGHGYR